MDMQKHIRELKDMRRVMREECISNAAIAEHLDCTAQSVFDITQGTTKEGELRDKVYDLLASNEVAAQWHGPLIRPCPPEEQVTPVAELHDAWMAAARAILETHGIGAPQIAKHLDCTSTAIYFVFNGTTKSGPKYDFVLSLADRVRRGEDPFPAENKLEPVTVKKLAPPAPVVAPVERAVVIPMPAPASDYESLMAQAMAAEELAESLKDLALLRQAERRHAAAVAIAQSVGLNIVAPRKKIAAA